MKVTEVAFVGYPVTDLNKACWFYEDLLGLVQTRIFGDRTQGWLEYDIGPATLAITNMAPDWKPAGGGGSVAFEVDDMTSAVDRLKAARIRFVNGPFETPICHILVVADPDGNLVTIHQRKKT